jgi:hypothetical protein
MFETYAGKTHPAFGVLKGTFTVAAGWNLTDPALDGEDLQHVETNIEETAALVEKGLGKHAP